MNHGSNSYTGGTVVNDPVTLQAASGIVFPNDATGNTGVVINGCTVSMTNIGQIGSGNVVTLNGATLSLFGDNTYAGLNINAVGAGSSITSGGLAGTLTLTGNITSTSDGAYGGSTIGTTYLALPSNANVNVSQATFNGQVINPLNADLTISAAITAGGFTKQGAGVLVLSASNPTTGAVAMQAGTMLLRAANSFGSMNITGGVVRADVQQSIGGTTSTVTLNGSTATLWMNIGTVGSSTNTLSVGASGGTLASYGGDRTLGMPVSLTGALTVDLRDPTNTGITRQVTINQAVTGSGSLVVAGNASGDTSKYLSLSNASNNYSGGTTLNSGGRILLQNAASLGSVNGTLTVNTGGYLDLNGQDLGVGKLTGTGGTIINNLTGAKTLTIGNNDATGGNFAGSISAGSQTLNLVKTGTGTQTLSGPNTYTGDTTVAQGALETTTIVGANSNTTVAAGASLTADSIVQNTLTIGAGATVTIRATTGAGSASAVPEPGTWALIGIGLLSLLAFRRRR
jgi:autotransporter-associated beta strand protein